MRFSLLSLLFALIATPVFAAEPLPVPPNVKDIPALQMFMEENDAEIDFVSRQYGVDMWIATKNDIMQVIYTTPDGRGMLMNGFLFAPDGSLVTEQSMKDYAEGKTSVIKDMANEIRKAAEPKTPGGRMWSDLEKSNYIELGSRNAPTIYTFVDPYCPHCKKFWASIVSPYVQEGQVNIRLIPVGILGEKSANMAAYMLTQTDRQKAWLDLTYGNLADAPAADEKSVAPVLDNFKTMQKWKMQSTPFSVYKDPEGKVKMYRGNPDDMAVLMKELGIAPK